MARHTRTRRTHRNDLGDEVIHKRRGVLATLPRNRPGSWWGSFLIHPRRIWAD